MRQFIAPKVLLVNGQPAVCECEPGLVCWACVQANLILWEREEGGSVKANGASIIALSEAIKKKGLRAVSRELGVDHKAITHWIKSKSVPEKYVSNGVLMGEGAVSEGVR